MALDVDKIRRSAQRVAKFVKRNPKVPSSDAVHKLRTRVRRLESSLVAMNLASKPSVESVLRSLKKTRRLAGRIRDMDVLTAKALTVDHRREQACLITLLNHLGAKRRKSVRKLRRAVEEKQRKLLRGLERVDQLAARPRDDIAEAAPAVATRAIQLSSALSRPGPLSKDNLHAYRLHVKELRDVLRLSDKAADSAIVERLEAVKDAIGDWHDWVELTDIAVEVLDHGSSCALIRRLETTRDARYRHAMSLTRLLIARHLRAKPRKPRKRPSAKAPLATPVLEAVTRIAQETTTRLAR